jgi:hypothetical protein
MRLIPFTRPTLVAAVEFLETHNQARFDQMILRLGLEGVVPSGTAMSVPKKCNALGRVVVQQPTSIVEGVDGNITLAEAVVREAVQLVTGFSKPLEDVFLRGLARDGYVVQLNGRGGNPQLRVALPNEIGLPAIDDEVHEILKYFCFNTPLGHLGQAIEAHTHGDWAAANGQLRTFLESMFDDIAKKLRQSETAQRSTSENRRALLAEIGFLAVDRNEWTRDGKNYINGLFKMLHTEGSHPGLSDEDHSTFRLHVVLVTARTFLRRIRYEQ